MKVLFQADADLNQNILLATVRQQPGIDFQSATKAGLIGLNDQEVLALMPQHLPIGLCSEQLVLIWSATEAEEWVNRICYLPL